MYYTKASHPVEIAEMHRVGKDKAEKTGVGWWGQRGPKGKRSTRNKYAHPLFPVPFPSDG